MTMPRAILMAALLCTSQAALAQVLTDKLTPACKKVLADAEKK